MPGLCFLQTFYTGFDKFRFSRRLQKDIGLFMHNGLENE
jgi:hypothetical protein